MCDYSSGPATSADDMVSYVQEGLSLLNEPCHHLLVSPSGSMLDDKEVPPVARRGIYELLRPTPHRTFSLETRADTVTATKVDEAVGMLDRRLARVYIGLESADPYVSKYCINKATSLACVRHALSLLNDREITPAANVILGAPFLTSAEAIQDTVQTVLWSLQAGAGECYLFPTHVKEATALYYLYQKGLYQPPSLWSLICVLVRLGPEVTSRVRLSWYTSYGAYNIVASPGTCPNCYPEVISLLDRFANFGEYDAVEQLNNMRCGCKEQWAQNLAFKSPYSLYERVLMGYDHLASDLLQDSWWSAIRNNFLSVMKKDLLENGAGALAT
jgi:archaeosine synthase beta-subunit